MSTKGIAAGLSIAMIVIAAGAAYWRLSGPKDVAPQAVPDPVPAPDPVDAGSIPELPAADGDALLRKLAAEASISPLLAKWLAEPGILQRIAAAVRLIARGDSPAPVLQFIDLRGDLEAVNRGGRLYISPKSYARYDGIVEIFASIDPVFAGQAYRELSPYLESIYVQVASPGERFADVLAVSVRRLANVKVPEGPAELVEKGAIYAFKDPDLERLAPCEKHVLRLGPKNAFAFQTFLRRFAENAGLR